MEQGSYNLSLPRSLYGDDIWIEDIKISFKKNNILSSPRIGVDYAGTDAKLPYRF